MQNVTVANLFPDQRYDAYFVAQDAMEVPNVQLVPFKVAFRAQCQFIPRIIVKGPEYVYARPSRGVTLLAVPRPDGCVGSTLVHPMIVYWEVLYTEEVGGVDLGGAFSLAPLSQRIVDTASKSTTDVRRLRLEPEHVYVGHRYGFRVTTWSTIDPRLNASAEVVVEIIPDDLVPSVNGVDYSAAVIFGGVPVDNPLVLDASASVDLEATARPAASPLQFHWSCSFADGSGPCRIDVDGTDVILDPNLYLRPDRKVLTLPALAARNAPREGLTFTLVLTAGEYGGRIPLHRRSATMNVTVELTDGAAEPGPSVHIDMGEANNHVRELVDPGSDLILEGTAAPGDSGQLVQELTWKPDAALANSIEASGVVLIRPQLVIPRNTLVGGRNYRFQLVAVDTEGRMGTATVVVIANDPPSHGWVSVHPRTGVASLTEFLIGAPGWSPFRSSTLPLSYRFGVRPIDSTERRLLTAFSTANSTTTTLSDGGRVFRDRNLTYVAFVQVRLVVTAARCEAVQS